MEELLQRFGEQQLVGFILVLARIGPLFLLAPLFSSRLAPVRVRGIVAVALAIGLTPIFAADARFPTDPLGIGELILKEMLVGAAFAFAVAAVLAAVNVAGSFLDTFIGYSYGGVVDPLYGTQSAVMSQAYGLIGLMVFIAIGGDAWVIQGIARTYELVPVDGAPALGSLTAGVLKAFTSIFVSAVQVAGPVILALVLTDVGFGLATRVVPQMNVFSVGFPVKVLVGLVVVGATLPFVAGFISDSLQGSVADALKLLRESG